MSRKFANQFSSDPEERQMWAEEERRAAWYTLIGFLVFAALMIVAAFWYEDWRCSRPWHLSGMRTTWGPIQGCLVETKPGHWIPAERIRELP